MPFKSEAQRRYLWANEPEIARDWTDTYGSKIHAGDGGIMRLGFDDGGEVVDDNNLTYEESPYSNKYTEDEFNEVFGETDSSVGESFIDKSFNKVNDLYSGITKWGGPLWNTYKGNIGGAALGSFLGPWGIMAGAYAGDKLGSLRGYNEG